LNSGGGGFPTCIEHWLARKVLLDFQPRAQKFKCGGRWFPLHSSVGTCSSGLVPKGELWKLESPKEHHASSRLTLDHRSCPEGSRIAILSFWVLYGPIMTLLGSGLNP
jgi:hypothetical protein